jgi:hypothetical protein
LIYLGQPCSARIGPRAPRATVILTHPRIPTCRAATTPGNRRSASWHPTGTCSRSSTAGCATFGPARVPARGGSGRAGRGYGLEQLGRRSGRTPRRGQPAPRRPGCPRAYRHSFARLGDGDCARQPAPAVSPRPTVPGQEPWARAPGYPNLQALAHPEPVQLVTELTSVCPSVSTGGLCVGTPRGIEIHDDQTCAQGRGPGAHGAHRGELPAGPWPPFGRRYPSGTCFRQRTGPAWGDACRRSSPRSTARAAGR